MELYLELSELLTPYSKRTRGFDEFPLCLYDLRLQVTILIEIEYKNETILELLVPYIVKDLRPLRLHFYVYRAIVHFESGRYHENGLIL